MKKNVLYLMEMGMYDSAIPGDIKNHRVRVLQNIPVVFEGVSYDMFFEFTQWDRYHYRTTNKRTGKELVHPVKELVNHNALHVDTEFEREEEYRPGKTYMQGYRSCKLEAEIHAGIPEYTKKDILAVVNRYAVTKFDSIVLIETEARRIINSIGGYREKAIIADKWTYCKVSDTWTDEHKVLDFISRVEEEYRPGCTRFITGVSCSVDIVTGRIVG